ncbi:hypothetical protein BJX64DRAFT_246846 [Aspergillus heterothallicus]
MAETPTLSVVLGTYCAWSCSSRRSYRDLRYRIRFRLRSIVAARRFRSVSLQAGNFSAINSPTNRSLRIGPTSLPSLSVIVNSAAPRRSWFSRVAFRIVLDSR